MARIRTIKPEFWTSEQILECSTNARLLFIGMWNFCDDGGVHVASIKTLKAQVFPADDLSFDDIQRMIDELSSNDLIQEYRIENKAFWKVTGWHHQKIDRPNPKYPQPPTGKSTNDRRTIDSVREGKGREGKKESSLSGAKEKAPEAPAPPPKEAADEKPKSPKRGTRMEEGWRPDATDTAFAADRGYNALQIDSLAAGLHAHSADKGTISKDWHARWRTWVLRDLDFHGPPGTRKNAFGRADEGAGGFAAAAIKVAARMEGRGNGVGGAVDVHSGGAIMGGQGSSQDVDKSNDGTASGERNRQGTGNIKRRDEAPEGGSR